MQTISINFVVPQGWHELSDKQLRYAYSLIASDFASDEIKTLCLLQWSGTKVIGRQDSGSYLLKKGKILFEVTPLTLAELLPHLDWLGTLPTVPVRISKINRAHALPADFSEVPFETYIIVDNLYQGYLQTQSDDLLDELANVLYGKPIKLKPYERINIFYWVASLKDFSLAVTPTFFNLYLPPPAAISSACCSSTSFSISFIMLSKSNLSSVSMFILLFLIAIFH